MVVGGGLGWWGGTCTSKLTVQQLGRGGLGGGRDLHIFTRVWRHVGSRGTGRFVSGHVVQRRPLELPRAARSARKIHSEGCPGFALAMSRLRTTTLLACFLLLSFFRNIFPTVQVTHSQYTQAPIEPPTQPPPRPQQWLPPQLPPPPIQSSTGRVNIPLNEDSQLVLERAAVLSQRQLDSLKAGPAPSGHSDVSRTLGTGLEALVTPDALMDERRQREVRVSTPSSEQSQLSMAESPQTFERSCSKRDKEACLRSAVEAVKVWDYQKGAFMLPTQAHVPLTDNKAHLLPWDGAGTVWSCAGTECGLRSRTTPAAEETPGSVILRRIWDAWESTESRVQTVAPCNGRASNASAKPELACTRREARQAPGRDSEAAASRRAVARLLVEGQQAQQREVLELKHRLLDSTTRLHTNRPCWRNCRAEGACEWCGTNLCCKASESDAGVCHGQGGRKAYKCTAVRTVRTYAAAAAVSSNRPQAERRAEALARRQAEEAEESWGREKVG